MCSLSCYIPLEPKRVSGLKSNNCVINKIAFLFHIKGNASSVISKG